MIKSYTASTREIDDPELAVSEILTALDLENNMLKNSLGIISYFSDYAQTGALKAICEALPFDCIGATTCLCACGDEVDQMILSITVLTSDDCSFDSIMIPITDTYETTINNAMSELMGRTTEKPAMFLCFFPLLTELSGDMMLSVIDKATGGIPMFGTGAVDHTMDYSSTGTVYNGESYGAAIVMSAVYGAPKVSFEVASLNENKIRKQKAIITESNGNVLISVNGKSVLDYLEELGLTMTELSAGVGIVPFVLDHQDGTKPVARGVFSLTPEGYAICAGSMPVGATLAIGRIEKGDVLQTTGDLLTSFTDKSSTILGYTCIARYFSLGADNTAEADSVRDLLADSNYLFAYSGGEICPLPDSEGKLINHFHNFSIVLCKIS